ncbi:MAG: SDR family oxidoreductase [Sulfolobales archaeon]
MDLGLKGRVALVTASTKGIGFGVARVLVEEGVNVVITSRNRENVEQAVARLKGISGAEVFGVTTDLRSREDIENLVKQALDRFGRIDILVYNTGPPKLGTFMELSFEDWEDAVKLLLLSAVWLTKLVVPGMIERRWGRLIYITSSTLKQILPNIVLSNTVRLGIAGLVKSLAVELGPKGITTNGIMQGHIETERVIRIAEDLAARNKISVDEALRYLARDIPLGRLGKPEEIGYLAAFLASDKASYINGAMILIDGGYVRAVL